MLDYNSIKDSIREKLLGRENYNFLTNNLLARFIYEGLPLEEIDIPFLEFYLLDRGECAFWKNGEEYVVTPCERIGDIDSYGRGKDLFCVTLNGQSKTFKDFKKSEDVVYIKNNKLGTRDGLTEVDARSLTEVMKSIDVAVINTRYSQLLIAKDETEKTLIESALEKIEEGKAGIVTSRNITDDDEGIRKVQINEVRNTDIIQYLHRAYDDTLRRFWQRNGMEVCPTTKLAQQTKDEITAGHNARQVICDEMLAERKRAVEDINRKFGLSASVDYAEA